LTHLIDSHIKLHRRSRIRNNMDMRLPYCTYSLYCVSMRCGRNLRVHC